MRPEQPVRRILLIRRRAMGDALVTLPAVAEVRRAWPSASIDLVMDRPFASLLEGLVDDVNVLVYPPAPHVSWLRTLRAGRYDLVIDWLSTPRTALWTVLTGAPLRVGYSLRRRWWAYNVRVPRNLVAGRGVRAFAGESFLDPLRELGLAPGPWCDGIAQDAPARFADSGSNAALADWLTDWRARPGLRVAAVMSATWPAKAWPTEHIGELFERMTAAGLSPALIPGPGDEELFGELRAGLEPDRWAPPTTLPELVRVLEAADLFVGTDCGVRHLAAAMGLPTVTLFGPTDAGGWNPASPAHVSVRTDPDCAPCDLTHCPVPGHPCMTGLLPAMVLEAVLRLEVRLATGRTP